MHDLLLLTIAQKTRPIPSSGRECEATYGVDVQVCVRGGWSSGGRRLRLSLRTLTHGSNRARKS